MARLGKRDAMLGVVPPLDGRGMWLLMADVARAHAADPRLAGSPSAQALWLGRAARWAARAAAVPPGVPFGAPHRG